MQKKEKQQRIFVNNRKFRTIGGEKAFWSDLFHRALTANFLTFICASFSFFVFNNMCFAALYFLDQSAVSNVVSPRLLNLFFFSIEAFTTVGFGDMHPASTWGHMVFSLEGFVSVIETAALTGLIFERFSRPRARILFAKNPVIGSYDGSPHLMLRLANSRNNILSDASVQLWVLRNEENALGERFRRFHELPLLRQQNPTFILSWTLFHKIDSKSLLFDLNATSFEKQNYQLIVTIKGVDATSSQEMRARQIYGHEQVLWGHQYQDILSLSENGETTLDYRKFHETRTDHNA
jgi:inward rectifier potassium channel